MKKPQHSQQKPYVSIGILFTSALILAAFTYSEKDQVQFELSKIRATEINYAIEPTKKPIEKAKPIIQKKRIEKRTTSLVKDITSTAQKTTNKNTKITSNVTLKELNIKYGKDPDYKITEVIPDIVIFPDVEARFNGGFIEMNKYITHNLNLNLLENFTNKDEFLIHIEFIVGSNGEISGIQIKERVTSELQKEIIELMTEMPKWIPAEFSGRKVNSKIFLPIRIYFK